MQQHGVCNCKGYYDMVSAAVTWHVRERQDGDMLVLSCPVLAICHKLVWSVGGLVGHSHVHP